jgi:enoyl-CoA hydratase/carnithine racemase
MHAGVPHRPWCRGNLAEQVNPGAKPMDDIVTECSEGILRVELNRPEKLNAMTSSMYMKLADILNDAARDERMRVVLWHGAGDAFCAGNDLEDFLKNPPGPGDSPQARLMNALVEFEKPLIAAVHGAAIGGGTTMLLHCDFVYAGESSRFQMPFINLAVVPEFGSTCLLPLKIGHLRAAELILLGLPFDARRATELGLVTQVVSDQNLLQVATETAQSLARKPAAALKASKRLLKRSFYELTKAAMKAENEAFSVQVGSEEAKQALAGLLQRRPSHVAGN